VTALAGEVHPRFREVEHIRVGVVVLLQAVAAGAESAVESEQKRFEVEVVVQVHVAVTVARQIGHSVQDVCLLPVS
jgi:hypothetical protein